MGNDLYWKQTPKEPEEENNGLHYSTWHFLAELWNKEDRNDLAETVLTKKDIAELKTILITAKASNNKELAEDMQELIDAITKLDSVTLIIRG